MGGGGGGVGFNKKLRVEVGSIKGVILKAILCIIDIYIYVYD